MDKKHNIGVHIVEFASTMLDSGIACGTLKLKHQTHAISLLIQTWCCGNGFFKRSMEITNTSEAQSVGLTQFVPLKGCLWSMNDSLAENLRDNTVIPYSVGHFLQITTMIDMFTKRR